MSIDFYDTTALLVSICMMILIILFLGNLVSINNFPYNIWHKALQSKKFAHCTSIFQLHNDSTHSPIDNKLKLFLDFSDYQYFCIKILILWLTTEFGTKINYIYTRRPSNTRLRCGFAHSPIYNKLHGFLECWQLSIFSYTKFLCRCQKTPSKNMRQLNFYDQAA